MPMYEEVEASLAKSLEHDTDFPKIVRELPEQYRGILTGLERPSVEEAPLTFTFSAILKDRPEHIAEVLPSQCKNFERCGVLPVIIEYLKNQLRHPSSSANTLAVLEALAFCKFEHSTENITDDYLTLPIDLDMTRWQRFKEINHSATVNGYASINNESQKTDRDVSFKISSVSREKAHGMRLWMLKLLITNLNRGKATVDKWWPVVIPTLLNRLDDRNLQVKAETIELVHLLALNHAERLLHSGLIPVLEASIEPCMSFLSPLVEVSETKLIHRPAVLCLAQLSRGSPSRLNFIARHGCLKPFLHTKELADLTIYFFQTLKIVVNRYLQSLVVVHLNAIVDIITSVMSSPFLDGSPELALIADETMAEVISWAWPRIDQYKYKILLGLTKSNRLESSCCEMLGATSAELEKLRSLIESDS